jgi:hypothetical protein
MSGFFNLNLDATLESTAKKSVFLNIPADTTFRLRFLPPTNANGSLFTMNTNHFRLEDEEEKSIAPACLKVHGNGKCPLCDIVSYMFDTKDKALGKVAREIRASNNWYAQVLQAVQSGEDKDGNPVWVYRGPYLMRFSKTGTDAIAAILKAQRMAGEPFIVDPKKGKDILFTRTGTGLSTEYSAMPTGATNDLDTIFPGWKDALFPDVTKELGIRLLTGEQMVAAAQRAQGSIDWSKVIAESGVTF